LSGLRGGRRCATVAASASGVTVSVPLTWRQVKKLAGYFELLCSRFGLSRELFASLPGLEEASRFEMDNAIVDMDGRRFLSGGKPSSEHSYPKEVGSLNGMFRRYTIHVGASQNGAICRRVYS
jgi:hypothetical protein